jgi:hypothetical protein
MRKLYYLPVLVGLLILAMSILACKKQNGQASSVLENTTWKLTKEVWGFPNGNTEVFVKQSDHDGVFTWVFLKNQKINILHQPYSFEEIAEWSKIGDLLTIKFSANSSNQVTIRNYKIIELTNTFMKVDVELGNTFIASSGNGIASKVYYELTKQ